ncbi:glycosyltransferase [Lactococcus lactis]|uniref:glycosyltransferase n=1 Tax=Lactococcus lactis TaxID=1358 RepID=UPI00288F23D4|nr:glycosyltransferase [Lactococcus lactis]MDT2910305.1 glycosyltransferase [Lactococcus lactis]MDT2937344.1 glycosyltransferase [Lactococcus lactis]
MQKLYFITSTLPLVHGGRTKSLLKRAHLLNDRGIELTIISTNYNPDYSIVYQDYREEDKVTLKTQFENIYDYYRNKSTNSNHTNLWKNELEKIVGDFSDYVEVIRSKKGGRTYYYRGGIPKFMIKNSDSKNPEFFAIYNEWNFNPHKFYYINNDGWIHKIDTYDTSNELISQEFLTQNGWCYIYKEYKKNKLVVIQLHEPNNKIVSFSSEKEFIAYFFNDVFDENDVVVNDARFLDLPLLKAKVGKRIFQIHNPHLNNPLDNQSGVKGSFSNILNSKFPKTDTIVSLTEKQKKDIISAVPSLKENISVIPHSTTKREIKYQRQLNHFGVICRLHPQKNLVDAIKGFQLFLKEYPNYILDVYGDGESRQELEHLVNELDIRDKVLFHGNVKEIDRAYQSLNLLMITSDFEGFPLNALEAISNGTPIITYEVNYGPTDIIDENSGWVTRERTPEALKEKMIEAIMQPKNVKDVQKRSLKFSEENFVKSWLKEIGKDEK